MTKHQYTVITGASSGIGYAAAKAFANRGKHLILVARREAHLKQLRDEILKENSQLDIIIKPTDLSQSENVHKLYQALSPYSLETWINNAGFGSYSLLAEQDISTTETMLHLNIEALTLLSMLFVRDYQHVEGSQLINISSAGGYTIVPTAIVYCASKFYVSAFTEGLAQELITSNAKMRAKVLAPAATKTEFGQIANNITQYDYDKTFGRYHTSQEMAQFLLALYDNDKTVGHIDREDFVFKLSDAKFHYSGHSARNQKV